MSLSKLFAVVTPNDATHTSSTSAAFDSTGYTHVFVFGKHELAAANINPSDNKGSAGWSATSYYSHTNGDIHVQFFLAPIGTPGAGHTVTLAFTKISDGTPATVQYSRVGVWLLNSTTGAVAFVDETAAEGSGTAIDAGSLTTLTAAALFAAVGEYSASSFTPGTGWGEDWDLAGAGGSYSFGQSRLEPAAGTFDPACTQTSPAPWLAIGAAVAEAAPGPTITGTSSATPANGSALTITSAGGSTGFGATQGSGGVTLGGGAQTVTAWSDTSITETVDRTTNKYGVPVNIVVTNGSGSPSTPFALTSLQPQSGWSFVNIATPHADPALRLRGRPDYVSGDQIAWDTCGGLVTVYDDGTVSADPSVYSFAFEIWSSTGGGWGQAATQVLYTAQLTDAKGMRLHAQRVLRALQAAAAWLNPRNWGGVPLQAEKWFAPELTESTLIVASTSTAARSGTRGAASTSKGAAASADGREGPRAATTTSPSAGAITTARGGGRAATTTAKAATAAADGRNGALSLGTGSKAAGGSASGRAAPRAAVTAVSAIGASSTSAPRCGARAAVATVKAASAAQGAQGGVLANSSSGKAAGGLASGRAAARAATSTVLVGGVSSTSTARGGARASVATVKAAAGQAAASAGMRNQVAAAKAAATVAIARAGARASLNAAQTLPLAATRIYVLPPETRVWSVPAVDFTLTIG